MPIKYNLTKYDTLASKIKKIAAKKSSSEFTPQDRNTMFQAVLIASFASGRSWQTYRCITSPNGVTLRSPEVKKEFLEALSQKWKMVTPFDIGEVSTLNLQEMAFSEWLFSAVGKDDQESIKSAWDGLKAELSDSCDEVDRENP